MKIIITSKIAIALVECSVFGSIHEINKSNDYKISDLLPPGNHVMMIDNIMMIESEKPILLKEQSWTKLNKGKLSKRERRKHR